MAGNVILCMSDVLNLNGICWSASCKIKNELLLFGGYDGDNDIDSIHQYDIIDNQWTRLQSKLPKTRSFITATPILNGQFVLIFGGNTESSGDHDEIYIYSLRDGTFKESDIKCLEKGEHQAITISNKVKDKLTVFGYIRSEWSECGMYSHSFPREYLIKIICTYYLDEFITKQIELMYLTLVITKQNIDSSLYFYAHFIYASHSPVFL